MVWPVCQCVVVRTVTFLQVLDPFLFGLVIGPHLAVEGRRSVLEELLLPSVEDRRLQSQFVTELRNRLLFQQMAPQNRHLFFSG